MLEKKISNLSTTLIINSYECFPIQTNRNEGISYKLIKEKYDVITCWHSLEHVHEPWVYLDKIKKSLTVDGFLIVALPNYQSTDAKIYKEFWAAYDTPRHLYHFTIKSMNKTTTFGLCAV